MSLGLGVVPDGFIIKRNEYEYCLKLKSKKNKKEIIFIFDKFTEREIMSDKYENDEKYEIEKFTKIKIEQH